MMTESWNDAKCPECKSSDLNFSEDNKCICQGCKHEFESYKIFLSYGHDENTKYASKIKEDLKEKGHRVWFDLETIIEGREWERYIEEGIKWCDKVVLIVTPYSVRRRDYSDPSSKDGFCLNEIAKALEKNKLIIPVMLVEPPDGMPVSICRIQYLNLTSCMPLDEKESCYNTKFERLVLAIESDELDFEGGQIRLLKVLEPLDFKAEIGEHITGFQGRQWLIEKINNWLESDKESHVFWLMGDPGIGKTAISAYLSHNYSQIIAHHFCEYGHDDKSDPRRALLSLAYDIAQYIPEYYKLLQDLKLEEEVMKNPKTLFDNLFVQPLQKVAEPENDCIVLIDAIDEATKDGRNDIAEFIMGQWHRIPRWLRLIITSRPENNIINTLDHLNPYILDANSEENNDDIKEYIEAEFQELGFEVDENKTNKLIEKTEGIFLYLKLVLDEIKQGTLSIDEVDNFPKGLSGIYKNFFDRQFQDLQEYRDNIKPIIECICAQHEPLRLKQLSSALNINISELSTKLAVMGSIFKINKTVKPFHKSIIDWLTETNELCLPKAGDYAVDLDEGKNKLANICWKEYVEWKQSILTQSHFQLNTMSKYTLLHLPAHLIETARWDDLEELLTDLKFIESKCAEGMTFELIEDYKNTLNVLPEAQQENEEKINYEARINKYAADVIAYSKGEIQTLEIIPTVKKWANNEINEFNERIINNPTQLDRINAFGQFVNREYHNLVNFSLYPNFCVQQAYNLANTGPVADAAGKIIENGLEEVLLLRKPLYRHKYNSHPQLLKILEGHSAGIRSIEITPDGHKAISGGVDGVLKVWNLESGQSQDLKSHNDTIMGVAITPNGKKAISGGVDGVLRIWNLETFQFHTLDAQTDIIWDVAITPDGKKAITGNNDGTISIWDLETEESHILQSHSNRTNSVDISLDGKKALSGSTDGELKLWDLETTNYEVLKGHNDIISSVVFFPDAKKAISGSHDGMLRIWDLTTGESKLVKNSQNSTIWGTWDVAITPDGKEAVTGCGAGELRAWNLNSGQFYTLNGHTKTVSAIDITPDGSKAISGGDDKTVRLWDLEKGQSQIPEGHDNWVWSISTTPDCKNALSIGADKELRVWDMKTGQSQIVGSYENGLLSVAITPDAKTAITGCSDGSLILWNLDDGGSKHLANINGSVGSLAITSDGKKAITGDGGGFGLVCIVDLETSQTKIVNGPINGTVCSIVVAPDDKKAIAGSNDGTLSVWDMDTGLFEVLTDQIGDFLTIDVTPDGEKVVFGCLDGTVGVFDLKNKEITEFKGHTDRIWSIKVTNNGKNIISGGDDRTVRLWDLETRKTLMVYTENVPIISIELCPDNSILIGNTLGEVYSLKILNLS